MTDPTELAVNVVGNEADLTWDPSTSPGLLDYSVFRRSPSTGASFTPGVDTPIASGVTDESYADSGLTIGSYDWQVFARLFSPLDISGLVAWYDASVLSSVHATLGRVSQWDDLSGNGNHLLQGTGSVQPLSGVDTINGLNVLKFDAPARNDFMVATGVTIAQPFTAIFVVKAATLGSNAQVLTNLTPGGATVWADGGKWSLYAGSVADTAVSVDTSAHVITAIFNGASSKFYLDGSDISGGNPGTNGRTTIAIGADGVNAWNGDIASGVFYDSILSTGNRHSLEDLLQEEFATP